MAAAFSWLVNVLSVGSAVATSEMAWKICASVSAWLARGQRAHGAFVGQRTRSLIVAFRTP
jgi:hypothetical protein